VGEGGGSPLGGSGLFFVNSRVRPAQIVDGTSHTAAASESLLGQPTQGPHDSRFEYKFALRAPLSDAICEASQQWNYSDPRGFAWVNGEYRAALYNHYLPPNADRADCIGVVVTGAAAIRFTPFGWRTARSAHRGVVNTLLADGSVQSISEAISIENWQALATRSGGEVPSN
jgi:hypothetical protein